MLRRGLTLGTQRSLGSVKDKLKEKPKQKDFLRIKLKKKKKKKKAKSGKKSLALGLHTHLLLCMCTHCDIVETASLQSIKYSIHSSRCGGWAFVCGRSVISVAGLLSLHYANQKAPAHLFYIIACISSLARQSDSAGDEKPYFILALIFDKSNTVLFIPSWRSHMYVQYVWHAHRRVGCLSHWLFHTIKRTETHVGMIFIKMIVPDCSWVYYLSMFVVPQFVTSWWASV